MVDTVPLGSADHPNEDRSTGTGNTLLAVVAGQLEREVFRIWSGPKLAEYFTAPDARRHLWHAYLSSYRVIDANRADPSELLDRLTFSNGRELLSEAYEDVPPGLTSALSKLGGPARSPHVYRSLVTALARGGDIARVLQHQEYLSDEIIVGANSLPAGMNRRAVAAILNRGLVPGSSIGVFGWTLKRLEEFTGNASYDEILSHPDPLSALNQAIAGLPFPDPPWMGTNELRPVLSASDLRELGTTFRNCMGRARERRWSIQAVLNGTDYFYHWTGSSPALLRFEKTAGIGWYLAEMEPPRGRCLPERTTEAIAAAVAESGVLCFASGMLLYAY